MRRRRATVATPDNVKLGRAAARIGEWAQHFSNASCFFYSIIGYCMHVRMPYVLINELTYLLTYLPRVTRLADLQRVL